MADSEADKTPSLDYPERSANNIMIISDNSTGGITDIILTDGSVCSDDDDDDDDSNAEVNYQRYRVALEGQFRSLYM